MLTTEKKITLEWTKQNEEEATSNYRYHAVSNPINIKKSDTDKLSQMVETILNEELPMLKNNSLLHDLVMYTVTEKMKTVQTVENVLSYIKKNDIKKVSDVSFANGEILIKCST